MGPTAKPKKGKKKVCKWRAQLSRRTKDPDQILASLTPEGLKALEEAAPNPNLPGEGKHYCVICDKHLISEEALKTHCKGKPHKLQLRRVLDGGFSQTDAELAAGRGRPDNGRSLGRAPAPPSQAGNGGTSMPAQSPQANGPMGMNIVL